MQAYIPLGTKLSNCIHHPFRRNRSPIRSRDFREQKPPGGCASSRVLKISCHIFLSPFQDGSSHGRRTNCGSLSTASIASAPTSRRRPDIHNCGSVFVNTLSPTTESLGYDHANLKHANNIMITGLAAVIAAIVTSTVLFWSPVFSRRKCNITQLARLTPFFSNIWKMPSSFQFTKPTVSSFSNVPGVLVTICRPRRLKGVTSNPHSASAKAPKQVLHATSIGVLPSLLAFEVSARLAINKWTTSRWPRCTAINKGVFPSIVVDLFWSMWLSSKMRTASTRPKELESSKGVIPSAVSSWPSFSAPASNNKRMASICPPRAAWCKGILPPSSAQLGFWSFWSNLSTVSESPFFDASNNCFSCWISGDKKSNFTNWILVGTALKTSSSSISREKSSTKNFCRNLETPSLGAKTCFTDFAVLSFTASSSTTANICPDAAEHTSIFDIRKVFKQLQELEMFQQSLRLVHISPYTWLHQFSVKCQPKSLKIQVPRVHPTSCAFLLCERKHLAMRKLLGKTCIHKHEGDKSYTCKKSQFQKVKKQNDFKFTCHIWSVECISLHPPSSPTATQTTQRLREPHHTCTNTGGFEVGKGNLLHLVQFYHGQKMVKRLKPVVCLFQFFLNHV